MASKFQYPLQCIQHIRGPTPHPRSLLVASAGPNLYSFSAEDGRRLSIWPRAQHSSSEAQLEKNGDADSGEPPEKKRRISSEDQKNDQVGPEPSAQEGAQSGKPSTSWSTIPIVVASPTGHHIVAVTGEDKCIRVFEIGTDGSLVQLSER
jgi:tRNA (guanine-N(7)-)-methyltransferase subunit TRM82